MLIIFLSIFYVTYVKIAPTDTIPLTLVPGLLSGGFGWDGIELGLLAGMFAAANQLFLQIIGLQQNSYYSVLY